MSIRVAIIVHGLGWNHPEGVGYNRITGWGLLSELMLLALDPTTILANITE